MAMLDDKVAIVTGSARGIGRETAALLADHGAKVLINDLDSDLAAETAAEIGGETLVFAGDLTEPDAPERLVKRVVDEWGRVDILINNAGYTLDRVIHKMTDDAFQQMLDIHLVVPFRMCRAVAPYFRDPAKREREAGVEVFRKVVNISSVTGAFGNSAQVNYASGKAGVIGLTKTLAKEWGRYKVNVNAVFFGYIDTRLTQTDASENTMQIGGRTVQLGMPEQVREAATADVPLGRPGTAQEAAGGVFLLCTPWADYITGQVLGVTGGVMGGMIS